ncbi:MAG: Rieske (2Fe-2S) protein [Bacteroidota bacterium]
MAGTGRRDFLRRAIGFWALASVSSAMSLIVQFLTPRKAESSTRETLVVGTVGEVGVGSTKIVRFNKEPVALIHTPSGQFKAFSARCTHLGCVVQFQPEPVPHFGCNCHGSQFDMNGRNIAGPAPRPLSPFRVNVQGSSIYLTKV